MSDFFVTTGQQDQNFRDALEREPRDGGPFEGFGRDTYAGWIARPGVGANRLAIQAGRFAEDAWRGITELDDTPALEGQKRERDTWWEDFFSANEEYWRNELERSTVDPTTRSDAANLIGGLSNTLGSFIAPTIALGPLGGKASNIGGAAVAGTGFGRESQRRLEAEGVTPDDALGGGLIEGGWMSAMGLLPVSIPGRIWQRAASGAALNLGAGVGMRGSMNEYLNSIGRADLAERYQWFDGQAMTIDTVLGATFGALFGRRPAGMRPLAREARSDDGASEADALPDEDAPSPMLPETGEGFLDEARLYGNEEMYPEAYAYALIARDMGAAEADGVIALLEEDASAADLEAGLALANEIAGSQLERAAEPLRPDAILHADTMARQQVFGLPEDPASARWARNALSRMEGQAARDEPLNAGEAPEDVGFTPAREDWETDAIFDDIGQALEDDLRERGLGEAADRMQAMREARPGLFDPDEPLFSMGAERRMQPRWQAAIRDPDTGRVYVGANHAEAIDAAPLNRQDALADAVEADPSLSGFVSDGRFLTREEAMAAMGDAALRAESVRDARRTSQRRGGYKDRLVEEMEATVARGEAITFTELARRIGLARHAAGAHASSIRSGLKRGDLRARFAAAEEAWVRLHLKAETDVSALERLAAEGKSMAEAGAAVGKTKNEVVILARRYEIRFSGKRGPKTNQRPTEQGDRWLAENERGDTFAVIAARENVSRGTVAGEIRRARVRRGQSTDTAPDYSNMAERLGISEERIRAISASKAGEGDALYSQGDAESFSTVEALKARAEREFGVDWARLEAAGRVEIAPSIDVLAARLRAEGKDYGAQVLEFQRPAAVHYRSAKKTYFFADSISLEDLRGIVLHEVGVHHGMPEMLGKRGWNELLRQMDRMADEGHPEVANIRQIAEEYVAEGKMLAEDVREETLAYLIEYKADLPIVTRILSRLRQWLIKTFGSTFGMRLTVDDLRALAVTSLRRVAEQARRESMDVAPIGDVVLASQGPDAGRGGAGQFAPVWRDDELMIMPPSGAAGGGIRARIVGDELRIEAMGLPQELRGQGLGRSLLETAIREGQARGLSVVSDYSVSDDFLNVARSLQRHGWEVTETPGMVKSGRFWQANGDPVVRFGRANSAPDGGHFPERQWGIDAPEGAVSATPRQTGPLTIERGPNENGFDYFVARDADGNFVGHVSIVRDERGGSYHPEDMLVLPQYRRQGVMTQLINEAERQLGEIQRPTTVTQDGRAFRRTYFDNYDPARRGPISGAALEGDVILPGREMVSRPPPAAQRQMSPEQVREGLRRVLGSMADEIEFQVGNIDAILAAPDIREVGGRYQLFNRETGETVLTLPEGAGFADADRAVVAIVDTALANNRRAASLISPENRTPNGGPAHTDFPLFSMGRPDGSNVLRQTLESPAFRERLSRVETRLQDAGLVGAPGKTPAARGGSADGGGRDGAGSGAREAGRAHERGGDTAGARNPRLDAESVRDILDVSGLRIQSMKDLPNGEFMVTIDAPFKLETDQGRALLGDLNVAGEAAAQIRFDILGPAGGRFIKIKWTSVGHSVQGMKVGSWLYRTFFDWALDEGYGVHSDTTVSHEARAVYDSLERRGYRVRRNAAVTLDEEFSTSNDGRSPVFIVERGESVPARDHAPAPPAGWMIDGLTLRQRLDEIEARQKAYDDASPAEQALMDDPDMPLFSMGPARKVSAREAVENAKLEQETARRVSLGAQAAAKCAARHGLEGGIFAGATAAAGNAAALGRGIGLAAAIPAGIALTPPLARRARQDANPDAFWRNEAAFHTARAKRMGAQMGALAGLDDPTNVAPPIERDALSQVADPGGDIETPEGLAPPPVQTDNPSRILRTDFQSPPEPGAGRDGFAPPDGAQDEIEPTSEQLINLFDPVIQSGRKKK